MTQADNHLEKHEDQFIQKYFAPLAHSDGAFGLQDDAATLAIPNGFELVVSTDMLVESVHFFKDDHPLNLAKKALRVNLSDIAAKGAKPFGYFLSLALPGRIREDGHWLSNFSLGLKQDQDLYEVTLLGGDTTAAPEHLVINICAYGLVPKGKMIRRQGASVGDLICVTGEIGGARLGLAIQKGSHSGQQALSKTESAALELLDEDNRHRALESYLLPKPAIDAHSVIQKYSSSAMDISDGLTGDAYSLLKASHVGGVIDVEKIPLFIRGPLGASQELIQKMMLSGGDDYQILFTVNQGNLEKLKQEFRGIDISCTSIGQVIDGNRIDFLRSNGSTLAIKTKSYDHFAT